jgi:hypothetical protein
MFASLKIDSKGNINLKSILPHKDISPICFYSITPVSSESSELVFYDSLFQEITIANLPTKKKISCTKNLVLMTKYMTSNCWKSAGNHVDSNYSEISDPTERAILRNSKYLENLCQLDSDVIESIILCHRKKKATRASITITTLNNELARRYLLNDSSQIERQESNLT